MKISEIITDKYKLRIPPTVYYDLLADVQEAEEEQESAIGVDCISRTRAIERLKLNFPISQGADNSRDRHRYMQAMADIQAIRELPSVTPQDQRKGHWIECMPGGAEEWCYKCSECNFYKFKKTINLRKFKYCPNCGAKMVEPQESEVEE